MHTKFHSLLGYDYIWRQAIAMPTLCGLCWGIGIRGTKERLVYMMVRNQYQHCTPMTYIIRWLKTEAWPVIKVSGKLPIVDNRGQQVPDVWWHSNPLYSVRKCLLGGVWRVIEEDARHIFVACPMARAIWVVVMSYNFGHSLLTMDIFGDSLWEGLVLSVSVSWSLFLLSFLEE